MTANYHTPLAYAGPLTSAAMEAPISSLDSALSIVKGQFFNVLDYGAVGDGTTDDTAAIQAAINAAIPAGGTVTLGKGPYRITAALDFSAMKDSPNMNRGVRLVGRGAGDNNAGFASATTINNDHAGPAIKAIGSLAGAVSKSIAALHLSDFSVVLKQSIGANYAIDLDYVIAGLRMADIYIKGDNLGGAGGVQWRNMGHGQGILENIIVRGFHAGIGFRFAVEVTATVDVAPNSGNFTVTSCCAFDVKRGFECTGTNLFNSVALVACKAVNTVDIVGSVGFNIGTGCRNWSLLAPHAERFSTGYQFDYSSACTAFSALAAYPTGTPDALSAGVRMLQSATGNVVIGLSANLLHYGVSYEGDSRTNSVHGSDHTGTRVLTAWSRDISSDGNNHVIKTEGTPFLWKMPKTQMVVGQIGLTDTTNPSLTASVDNWTGAAGASICRIASNGAYNITGIAAPTQAGHLLRLYNISASTITLIHGSASSNAANQMMCAGGVNVAIRISGAADLWYDGTSSRWRVLGA